jgi:DNA-binding NarL/FixJ family response regulator
MKTQVAVVEDDERLRKQLLEILGRFSHLECVGSYGSAEDALAHLPQKHPDVVLMDINLPKMSGIQCVADLKKVLPWVQIIIVTIYEDSECIFDAIKAGANGYLIKSSPPEKLVEAIGDIVSGGSPMSSQIARKVLGYFRMDKPALTGEEQEEEEEKSLAPREEQVLDLLASGYRYKEIATSLNLSTETIRTYIKNACKKLHVKSRIEAALKYRERQKK